LVRGLKVHVPDTFQLGAIFPFSAFLASCEINNLSVFNTREYSDILFRSGSVWRLVHAAIFFSFNCLRYVCALPISRVCHFGRATNSVVACGTGTLAITAKRRVGPNGRVFGIDASPEMIKRARKKARKAGVDVVLENAVVEKLPFPDATFDSVLSTVMLHHLPDEAR